MTKIRKQLEAWRDSYINIAIRGNNMLHQDPKNSKAIRFITNDYFTYSNFWDIASGKGDSEDYAIKSRANTDPRYNPIEWRAVREIDDPADLAYLDALVKTGYDVIVQKGENPICLTFGRLNWRVQNPDYQKDGEDAPETVTISSPVILIPIKLIKLGVNYWIKPVDDEAMINPALLLRYEAEGYKKFPMPHTGQWIDTASFDIEEYFSDLTEHFAGSATSTFDADYVSLDVFNYNKLCMYRDVSRHMRELEENKIIRAIFGETKPKVTTPSGLDAQNPRESFAILDSNTSQNSVIERFRAGESFILEGPPGTGKTQTIVNMIAEALMAHKKVLFVSGKMSALSTVMKKLKMAGVNIDKHCLYIKGEGEDKKIDLTETYGKLKGALEAPEGDFDYSLYLDNARVLVDTRDTLVGYNREFYSNENPLGLSIYDVVGRMLALGYGESGIIHLSLNDDGVANLTKEQYRALVTPVRDVETLVTDIIRRFGSIEGDVWYGFREYEFTEERRKELDVFRREVNEIKTSFENSLSSLSGDEARNSIISILRSSPLTSTVGLLDTDVTGDLGYLYIKDSLVEEKRVLEREIAAEETYRDARANYYAKCAGDSDATPEELDTLLSTRGIYGGFKMTDVDAELARIRKVSLFESFDGETIDKVIPAIQKFLLAKEEKAEIETKLLSDFTEDILTFEYLPLLSKFRTSWEKNLKEDKKPLLFDMLHIAKVKKCCKNAAEFDFGVKSVYELLESLDRYHRLLKESDELSAELKSYSVPTDSESAVAGLSVLCEYLLEYQKELVDHKISGLLYGEVTFAEHIEKKRTALEAIRRAATLIRLKIDMTADELAALVSDYVTVRANNRRISEIEILTKLFPKIKKDVRTNWAALLGLVSLVERVRRELRDENRSIADDYAIFAETVSVLLAGGVRRYASMLIDKYNSFYKNEEWFDFSEMGDAHEVRGMTYSDISKWFSEICDINNVDKYTAYRRCVRDLVPPSYDFFKTYIEKGRREYPIDKLGDNFELSLLYSYHGARVSRSKYVAKMSGKDGITTLESVMKEYSAADEQSILFNRKLLDTELYASIERSASGAGNLHNYLYAVPAGSNASVRRLFKNRSESIQELAPCIMMSVYSVSKLLDYEQYKFDVVIFDEASQIPAEDALTSLMRATSQVVISGDPKQMPAIRYFDEKTAFVRMDADDESDMGECPSILDFVISAESNNISYNRLDMHYRSNHESLIKYSNEHPDLYGGNLVTFPSPTARSRDFGLVDISLVGDSEYRAEEIVGGGGRNLAEAKVVIELIKEHFEKYPAPKTDEEVENYNSLGVIVFGTAQKKLLLELMARDPVAAKIATISNNRVFFITPVDEVQGDEMGEMILSLTYGKDADGKISQAWGHMNRLPVALYKFNVAVTRAKNNLKFVHSVSASDITNSNLSYVKDYLILLDELKATPFVSHPEYNTAFVAALGKICEDIVGKERVIYNWGESTRSYRVPISILSRDGSNVALGIMCEVNRAKEGFSVREYARTCPEILAAHGWDNLYSTYAVQWVRNYAHEKQSLIERLKAVL